MESYPFLFLGHGVGNLSSGFDAHILFAERPDEQAMADIQVKLQGHGEIRWSGNSASFCVSDRQIKGAMKYDPTYSDNPQMLDDSEIYKTFGLVQSKLNDIQQRLAHFYYDFQLTVQEIHQTFPVSLCLIQQGPRVKLTPWHAWSEERLPQVFDVMSDYFSREDVRSERFKDYTEVSYYDANAVILCHFIETIVRKKADVKKLSPETVSRLIEVIKSAIGYSDNSDNFLLSAALYLGGVEMEEIIVDFPEHAMEALEEINEDLPLDERFPEGL
ncbi:hypothetical protein ONV78_26810 [Hahella sp. CR1]|uniref:hypothetical protein n=1 Tax=Hahella sp. CR1 TaxID=2992807 RepID=UPI0024415BA2|nr:hypothetical protein [Hahella sp. CR1]MDG9671374.1 hypothetical protein [Hahella sp. CR1]